MKVYAGMDIGGTKVALGVFGEDKTLLGKTKYPSDASLSAEEFFQQAAAQLRALLGRLALPEEDLAGIGVGPALHGALSRGGGGPLRHAARPQRLWGKGLPGGAVPRGAGGRGQRRPLRGFGGIPPRRREGPAGTCLYCPVSTGLSSGIIIDGKLFRGSSGFAGESGHTILTPGQGIACGCGNQGCVQSYASGGMIVRHIRRWIDAGEQTLMVQLAGAPEKIDARHLEMAARAGDAMALRALDQMALYLGVWVFNLYITLNINCFVFGGGLVNMGELLFGRCGRCSTPTATQRSRWSFSSPSAARRRAFWARWSCCSNIGKCARGGEKFCQLLKKLRGVGAATSRWDVAQRPTEPAGETGAPRSSNRRSR